jgi:hypothetical protein
MEQFNSLIQRRRIWSFALLFIGISLLFTPELRAQKMKEAMDRRDSIKNVKIEQGKGALSFLGGLLWLNIDTC